MKKLILPLILIPLFAQAQEIPEDTIKRLQKLYPDQSVEFIQTRIKNAPTAFNKWRSFPPYYYEMIRRSEQGGSLKARSGLCAGDAHLENFGFIADAAGPQFTLNDLDDVTPCSLNADIMRLFIGQRLIHKDLKADQFLAQYQSGLKGDTCPQPKYIKKLSEDSIKKGHGLSKKNRAMLDAKTCTGEYAPLSDDEKNMLEAFIKAENGDPTCQQSDVLSTDLKKLARRMVNPDPKTIVHACSRVKESGGSAGGKRFVVFRGSAGGVVDAFELKPLVKSAPDFDVNVSNGVREEKYKLAVKTYLGPAMSEHYYPVTLSKTLYQRRPLWGGNEEVKEADIEKAILEKKADPDQKEQVMLYETCRLGNLHAKSNPEAFPMDAAEWEKIAQSVEKQFRSEFGQ